MSYLLAKMNIIWSNSIIISVFSLKKFWITEYQTYIAYLRLYKTCLSWQTRRFSTRLWDCLILIILLSNLYKNAVIISIYFIC